MATRRNANGAGEASVPPAPSASARETLDASVARLSGLNTDQLRLQWRNHLGGVAPAHLPGWLLLLVGRSAPRLTDRPRPANGVIERERTHPAAVHAAFPGPIEFPMETKILAIILDRK